MEIPEFTFILEELKKLKELINKPISSNSDWSQQWFNDKQCWEKKGGMALATYRNERFYQCKGGIPDGYVGGRKVWKKESVLEWVNLTDSELPAYHEKYKTGARKK